MSQISILGNSKTLTMSSREIADLSDDPNLDHVSEYKEKITLKTLVTGKGAVCFQHNFKD